MMRRSGNTDVTYTSVDFKNCRDHSCSGTLSRNSCCIGAHPESGSLPVRRVGGRAGGYDPRKTEVSLAHRSEEAERMENSEGLEEAEGAGSSASAPDQEENADASAPELPDKEEDLSAEASEKEKALSDEAPRKEESQKKRKEASETKTKSLYEKICLRIERVKYTFRRSCDKIRSLMKKKDRLTAFLANETHKRAFRRAVSELRRLLAFLFPKKLKAEVRFGFEDPAYTGYALAWISLLYPAIGDHIDLEPDFQHKILKGNIYAEGKLRVLYIIIPLWNLVWDKDVRITFRRIRKMKR